MMNSCGITPTPDIKVAILLHLRLRGSAQSVLFKNQHPGLDCCKPARSLWEAGRTLSAGVVLIVQISVFTWDCSYFNPTG